MVSRKWYQPLDYPQINRMQAAEPQQFQAVVFSPAAADSRLVLTLSFMYHPFTARWLPYLMVMNLYWLGSAQYMAGI